MSSDNLRVAILSDANLANLAALLRRDSDEPGISPHDASPGSVLPILFDDTAPAWSPRPDLTLVWTTPDGVLPSFAEALHGERIEGSAIDAEVDEYVRALEGASSRSRWTLVPTWLPPFAARGLGVMDLHDPVGLRALLLRANTRLSTRLQEIPGCYVLDAQPWSEAAGPERRNRRLWYAAKVPFPLATLQAAGRDVRAFLRAATGKARKVILLDLDNTLWGGVVGESGWRDLRLGGHDPVGEAFVDLQRTLKALTRRGIVLGIVSKNEEDVALEAIENHPEMLLRPNDFAGWRINWSDKAMNVSQLLEELRLGPEAAVFIDDQPAERARVAEAFPTLLVPDWPQDPLAAVDCLDGLAAFDLIQVSQEDLNRAESYTAERQRRTLRNQVSTFGDWLRSLDVRVSVSELSRESLPRATQLLNKTNQMNLSTRRLSEVELWDWAQEPGRHCYTVRVQDRFGDFGLTGLFSAERDGEILRVVDFLLSCRVMSRRVEEAMVAVAVEHGRKEGGKAVLAEFKPTDRNAPMFGFWRDVSRFEPLEEGVFRWDTSKPYPRPEEIALSIATSP